MQFKKGDVFATGSKTARVRVHIFCIFDDVAFFDDVHMGFFGGGEENVKGRS